MTTAFQRLSIPSAFLYIFNVNGPRPLPCQLTKEVHNKAHHLFIAISADTVLSILGMQHNIIEKVQQNKLHILPKVVHNKNWPTVKNVFNW